MVKGECVGRECAWRRGQAWQGRCAWQGRMCGGGGGACVAGEMATAAGDTHPTEMHSCLCEVLMRFQLSFFKDIVLFILSPIICVN